MMGTSALATTSVLFTFITHRCVILEFKSNEVFHLFLHMLITAAPVWHKKVMNLKKGHMRLAHQIKSH